MPALAATREFQQSMVSLRAVAYSDVTQLWALLDMAKLDASFPLFAAATLRLVQARRQTATTLAKSYLGAVRRQSGADGQIPVVPSPPVPVDAVLVALRISSVISVKVAMTRGTDLGLASRNALVRTMGVVDKFIGDGAREWIRAAVEADPAAQGWRRRTLGTCKFCASLAADEHVEGGSADFPRHPHCGCQPEPAYGPTPDEGEVELYLLDLADYPEQAKKDLLRALSDATTPEQTRVDIKAALEKYRSIEFAALRERSRLDTVTRELLDEFGAKISSVDDLAAANPKFASAEAYQVNCYNAVQAFELRARGIAVEAAPADLEWVKTGAGQTLEDIGNSWRDELNFPGTWDEAGSIRTAEKFISEMPDGARAVVQVTWGRTNGGHVFIGQKVDGVVQFIDPQNNYRYTVSELESRIWPSSRVMRIDNLRPTSQVRVRVVQGR